jgi:hypothetical protein
LFVLLLNNLLVKVRDFFLQVLMTLLYFLNNLTITHFHTVNFLANRLGQTVESVSDARQT